jgi:hypothetical protein
MSLLHPGEEKPGIVKHHLHRRMLLKKLEKREIRLPVRIFQDMVEVPHRLVIVDRENEMELIAALQKEILLGKVSRILLK